jgi:acyl dehydratase
MTAQSFTTMEAVEAAVGTPLGATEWLLVDQECVDGFADVTGDQQWIHVDPDRAKSSPFGGTIAHGFLTLSFVPRFGQELYALDVGSARLNFGLEKVRFPAPLPVGSRVRGVAEIAGVKAVDSGTKVNIRWTIEREGHERPVCVAETVTLVIP